MVRCRLFENDEIFTITACLKCPLSHDSLMSRILPFCTCVTVLNVYSCIDIYAHSCLRPFSIGRKPCSNSKTHVQIMKFTCRLNMGFGRRHWSMRRDVMCFVETKWPTLKKLRCFRWGFTLLVLFSRDFKWIRVKMQE